MVIHAALVQFFVPGCKNLEISVSALWSQVRGYNRTVLMQVWRPESLTGESQPRNRRPVSQPKQLKRDSTLLLPSCALQAYRELHGAQPLQGKLSAWPRVMVPAPEMPQQNHSGIMLNQIRSVIILLKSLSRAAMLNKNFQMWVLLISAQTGGHETAKNHLLCSEDW